MKCDVISPLPDIVDLPLQPLKDFIRLFFVLEGTDGDFITAHRDDLSLETEGHGRRFFQALKTAQFRIEIGQYRCYIFIQISDAAHRLKARIALRAG